jgi:chromate reductase, NAD(P)H dehydrogenase (quinone)
MNKILIIVGTNRTNSYSALIAEYYQKKINEAGLETDLINLSQLPPDFAFSALYQNTGQNTSFNSFQEKIDNCKKIVFVVPEYNGSFPGVLKAFIDGLRHPDSLSNKKACLVGVSSGVLGNAVGLGHLSDILSYLNMHQLGMRVKLGLVNKHFEDGEFTNEIYKKFVAKQIDDFMNF